MSGKVVTKARTRGRNGRGRAITTESLPPAPKDDEPDPNADAVTDAGYALGLLGAEDAEIAAFEAAVERCTPLELQLAIELSKGAGLADATRRAGYSYVTKQDGYKVRQRPHVATVERGLRRAALRRAEVDVAQIRAEAARIAFSDVTHYELRDGGGIVRGPNAPLDAMRAVASVKVKRTRRTFGKGENEVTEDSDETEYRLWNKPAALRLLAEDAKMVGAENGGLASPVLQINVVHRYEAPAPLAPIEPPVRVVHRLPAATGER